MPPSRLARAARLCLVGIVAGVPLISNEGVMDAGKPLVFLALAGVGGLLLAIDALRGREAPALGTPTDLALGVWLLAAVPSTLGAVNDGLARYHLALSAGVGLSYLLALKTVRTTGDVRRVYAAVLACAVVVSGFGLAGYQNFVASGAAEVKRASYLSTPFFDHSYLASQYLVMAFVGGLFVVVERGLGLAARMLVALALIPLGSYLFVVGSRGAWIAILLALGTSSLLAARAATGGRGVVGIAARLAGRGLLWGGLVVVLVVLARVGGVLSPGVGGEFVERLLLVFDPQATGHNFSRLTLWAATLELSADDLMTGVGLGCFGNVLPSYLHGARSVGHAHNQFLHVLAETGLVGLLALLYVLRSARHAAAKGAAFLADDSERRGLFQASVAALTAGLVYFLFETPLQWMEAGSLLVVLLAIMTRAGCVSRTAPAHRPLALVGLAVGLAVVVASAPQQLAYTQAMFAKEEALASIEAADEARAAGADQAAVAHVRRAIESLERADALVPHITVFITHIAQLNHQLGDLEQSLAWYRTADERVPGTFAYNSAIGNLLMIMGRARQAVAPLRAAVYAHRGLAVQPVYATLARACLQSQRYEEAWYIYSDLILVYAHQTVDPQILLDGALTLAQLGRTPDFGLLLLDQYARSVEGAADEERYARLRERLQQMAVRPKRTFVRAPGM